jgi:hypothetical protein
VLQNVNQAQAQGLKVHLGKVKAHIGVEGNEAADKEAKLAAQGQWEEVCETGRRYYETVWQLGKKTNDPDKNDIWYLNDINTYVDKQQPQAFKQGIYAELWNDISEDIHPLTRQLDKLDTPHNYHLQRTRIKYNWGQVYNNKLAQRYGHPNHNNGRCPICNHPDSVGHLTAECKLAKPHVIALHNRTVERLAKHIKTSKIGNYCMLVDHRHTNGMTAQGSTNQLPSWTGVTTPTTTPDIILFKGATQHQLQHANTPEGVMKIKQRVTVYVIEVGYIRDTCYRETYATKSQQHTGQKGNLLGAYTALTRQGWNCENLTILYGRGGTIYNTTVQALEHLQFNRAEITKHTSKNQKDSINTLYNTIVDRRIRATAETTATVDKRDPHWDPGGIG